MSFTISLHKEPKMTDNVKYRSSFSAPAIYTTSAVKIGNFSNFNLYVDNSVELNMGLLNPPIGNYQLATNCNYIKIQFDGKVVIGLITSWEYINDGNTNISYSVDAFMSARVSGFIDDMKGLCERVNLTPSSLHTNLQPEPFSPSDITAMNKPLTEELNTLMMSFENIAPTGNGVSDPNTRLILTVSPAIIEFLGVGAFADNPTGFSQVLKQKTTLDFYGADTTLHAGGTFRGTPLKFKTLAQVTAFIRTILGGCGFKTNLSGNGATGQNAISYHQYITDNNTGGGQTDYTYKNTSGEPMEAIRFITATDIYNLYCIPEKFAIPLGGYDNETGYISKFKTLGTLHRWGGESKPKNKLLAYPYYYVKIVTANGDTNNIIPQTHYTDLSTVPKVWTVLRFIGGDNPRIMGRFSTRGGGGMNSYDIGSTCDWFTVRNYPAVTLSINDSFNPQIQRDIGNMNKLSAIRSNAQLTNRAKNPIKQGYHDVVNGQKGDYQGQGWGGSIGQGFGRLLGNIDTYGGTTSNNSNLFRDDAGNEVRTAEATMNASNFIEPMICTVMGNDFLSQYGVPAFACYDQGATDTELFAFSRYLEEFGATCNSIINPLTNAGNIIGGEATIAPFEGRTFYQFSNIRVEGNMPSAWRSNIKTLFESGVYLIDN